MCILGDYFDMVVGRERDGYLELECYLKDEGYPDEELQLFHRRLEVQGLHFASLIADEYGEDVRVAMDWAPRNYVQKRALFGKSIPLILSSKDGVWYVRVCVVKIPLVSRPRGHVE